MLLDRMDALDYFRLADNRPGTTGHHVHAQAVNQAYGSYQVRDSAPTVTGYREN